jgi:hypothetical protein
MSGYRYKMSDLTGLVDRLNRTAGAEYAELKAYREATEAEKAAGFYSVANPGTFYLEGAYGGHKLVQVINYGGGVRDVLYCGYVSKRELYHLIGALLNGVGAIAETMAIRERAGSIEREIQERKDHRERVRLQILKAHSETVGS